MKNRLKKYINIFLIMVITFSNASFIVDAAPSVSPIDTKNGFLYMEAEDVWTNNLTTYIEQNDTKYIGGKAVLFNLENKIEPMEKEDPDIYLKFRADIQGTYQIWIRHYADTINGSGQNAFISYNNQPWTMLNFTAKPDEAEWFQITTKEMVPGEVYDLKIRGRQKYHIAIDTIVINTDPFFKPTDLIPKPLKEGEKAPGFEKALDAIVLCANSPFALVNGVKQRVDENNNKVAPYIKNDVTLVPVRFIAESLGANVKYNEQEETVYIEYQDKNIQYRINSTNASINGEDKKLDIAPCIEDGRTFVPLRATAEAFGKEVFWDAKGLIIISDTKGIYKTDGTEDEVIVNLIEEVAYERPSAEQVLKDFYKNVDAGQHPRIIADKETFDRIKYDIANDEIAKWIYDVLKEATDKTLDLTEVLDFIEKNKAEGLPTGNATCALYTTRIRDFSFLWQITGEEKYAKAVYEIMDNMAEVKNWRPGEFLICSETMTAMAIGYDWCYDFLSTIDGALEKIEKAIYEKGVRAGVTAYEGTYEDVVNDNFFGRSGWIYATTNWNHISNAGCGIASIALIDKYPKECSELISKTIYFMELGNENYYPDGGYLEGPSYWAYGTNYLTWYMMALDRAMGTTYGVICHPGIAQTCYYRPYITGLADNPSAPGIRRQWNYHDSGTGLISSSMYMWFADKLRDPNLAGLRYQEIKDIDAANLNPKLSGYETATPYDLIYYNKDNFNLNINMPLDRYFKGIESVYMRSDWNDRNAIYTGIHAGRNDINHGQMDAGNFIIEADGIRWAHDLGMDNYQLPQYFWRGQWSGRYNYYRERAESHNTIVINPNQYADQLYTSDSPVIRYESKPSGAMAIVDLFPAYGSGRVKDMHRGLFLTDDRTAIIVQDEITMRNPSEFYWFVTTMMNNVINISKDGRTAILKNGEKRMHVQIVSDNPNVKFTEMKAEKLPSSPPTHELEYNNGAFHKLTIHLTDIESLNLAVVFQLLEPGEEEPDYNYEYVPMSEWKISE